MWRLTWSDSDAGLETSVMGDDQAAGQQVRTDWHRTCNQVQGTLPYDQPAAAMGLVLVPLE